MISSLFCRFDASGWRETEDPGMVVKRCVTAFNHDLKVNFRDPPLELRCIFF